MARSDAARQAEAFEADAARFPEERDEPCSHGSGAEHEKCCRRPE